MTTNEQRYQVRIYDNNGTCIREHVYGRRDARDYVADKMITLPAGYRITVECITEA